MAASIRNGRTGNLPSEANVFVGRRSELAGISDLLTSERLVTLTGPGGVGKSRLALRAAHGARAAFPGGAWLVELSGLKNPDLLTNAVAEATRLTEQTLRPLLEAVCEHLDDGPLLLVLDTCEHVLDECAHVVQELLARVPGLRGWRRPTGSHWGCTASICCPWLHCRSVNVTTRWSCSRPVPRPPCRRSR